VKFKEIGEAYSVLSDQKKRQRYDTGHDIEDLDRMGGAGFHGKRLCLIFGVWSSTDYSIFFQTRLQTLTFVRGLSVTRWQTFSMIIGTRESTKSDSVGPSVDL